MSPAKSIQVTCGVNCGGTRGIDQRRGPCFALSPRSPGRDEGRKVVGGVGLEIVVGVERSACRRVAGCGIEVWDEAAGEGGLTVHGRGASSLKHRLRHGTEHIHLHPPFDLLTKPPNYPLWLKWPNNSALLPRSTTILFSLQVAFPSTMSRRRLLSSTRNFTTTAKCHEKPILNRYSRIVTQPKDQGASQV